MAQVLGDNSSVPQCLFLLLPGTIPEDWASLCFAAWTLRSCSLMIWPWQFCVQFSPVSSFFSYLVQRNGTLSPDDLWWTSLWFPSQLVLHPKHQIKHLNLLAHRMTNNTAFKCLGHQRDSKSLYCTYCTVYWCLAVLDLSWSELLMLLASLGLCQHISHG